METLRNLKNLDVNLSSGDLLWWGKHNVAKKVCLSEVKRYVVKGMFFHIGIAIHEQRLVVS